ncbi:NUDIX hydrolase [Nostoc sp. NIES-2111]
MADLPDHPLQLAALPYRRVEDGVEVLLVSSRETKRWIVPKGWPMPGRKNHKAAAIEAWEEAGVRGKVNKKSIGTYESWKRLSGHFVIVTVEVYALEVTAVLDAWKEKGQRSRMWAPPSAAAKLVDEPGLAAILADLSLAGAHLADDEV